MGFEDELRLILPVETGRGAGLLEVVLYEGAFPLPARSFDVDREDLVETEALEEILIARVRVDDLKLAGETRVEPESDSGQGSHECRIHHGAAFEIDDELRASALEHVKGELLEPGAIAKVTFAFDAHPDDVREFSDEDGRFRSHGGGEWIGG